MAERARNALPVISRRFGIDAAAVGADHAIIGVIGHELHLHGKAVRRANIVGVHPAPPAARALRRKTLVELATGLGFSRLITRMRGRSAHSFRQLRGWRQSSRRRNQNS